MTLFATSRQVSLWLNPPINTRSWKKEKETLEAEIIRLREVHSQKLSKEAQKLMNLPFRRAITKKEQADMGKLKKSVRGLIVVHPMTALGREMGLKEMTGFREERVLNLPHPQALRTPVVRRMS